MGVVDANPPSPMIRISLGNVGSGKTLMEVREIILDHSKRLTFTNIQTNIPHAKLISHDMIIKKELTGTKRNGQKTYNLSLNLDYWKSIKEPINVVIDEAHAVFNPRRSMSKTNIIMTDWIALIRRVLGQAESGEGRLVLITQLWNRIDVIAREMATQIRYHICHYKKRCTECNYVFYENSEYPEPRHECPRCKHNKIIKFDHHIEVWHFQNMSDFLDWKIEGARTYYKHYVVSGVEQYFTMYNTLQWENMFSEHY